MVTKMHTRQKSPEFIAFKNASEQALKMNPNLQRLDCLNPVKSIKFNFDYQSVVPNINNLDAWKQYLNVKFENCFLSLGVRDSLEVIFQKYRHRHFHLPSDTYPVYQMIAKKVEINYSNYKTIPSYDAECFTDIALITSPSPFGEDLQVDKLLKFLTKSKNHLLIIDRVYDYNNGDAIQPLIDTNQVFVCYSLSKTFLSPLVQGLTITPESNEIYTNSQLTKVLLTKYKDLPQYQQNIFSKRWKKLGYNCKSGYLTIVQKSFEELLKENILAVPGEVYGMDHKFSILSCLHESLGDL